MWRGGGGEGEGEEDEYEDVYDTKGEDEIEVRGSKQGV